MAADDREKLHSLFAQALEIRSAEQLRELFRRGVQR